MPDSKCNQTHPQYPAVKQAVQTLLLSKQSCTLKDFEAQYPKLAALFERDSLRNQLYRTKVNIVKEITKKPNIEMQLGVATLPPSFSPS